jgi:hypothetical protein
MYKALAIAILCVSFLAGVAHSSQLPSRYPATNPSSKSSYVIKLDSGVVQGIYSIDKALSYTATDFVLGSAFDGHLYNCVFRGETADTDGDNTLSDEANCTLMHNLTADSIASQSTLKGWLNLEVDVAETGSNVSYLTIKGTESQVAGASVLIDAEAVAGAVTLSHYETTGEWYFAGGSAFTITLPDVTSSGLSACFYVTTAHILSLDPGNNDEITASGSGLGDGVILRNTSATAGDFVCLINNDTDGWVAVGSSGTWGA